VHAGGTFPAALLRHGACSKNETKPERRSPTHFTGRSSSLCEICHPTTGKRHGQQPPSEQIASLPPFQPTAVQLQLQPHPTRHREHTRRKAEAAEKLLSWAQSRIKAGRISQDDREARAQALLLHANLDTASWALLRGSAREGRDHQHRSRPRGLAQFHRGAAESPP